jgi:hypothetical protein
MTNSRSDISSHQATNKARFSLFYTQVISLFNNNLSGFSDALKAAKTLGRDDAAIRFILKIYYQLGMQCSHSRIMSICKVGANSLSFSRYLFLDAYIFSIKS